MVTLPNGVDINNLIEDLKIYSWQAADILLDYSEKINDSNVKNEVLKSVDLNNPVTEADLKVNEIIIQRINEKYNDIDWDILSEENVKEDSENCFNNTDGIIELILFNPSKEEYGTPKNLKKIKEVIRKLYNIHYHSIHSSDNQFETINYSKIFFHPNTQLFSQKRKNYFFFIIQTNCFF